MKRNLIAVAVAAAALAAPLTTTASAAVASPAERVLMQDMNRVRANHGLAPLRPAPELARPARAHSRYLLRTGLFTHDGPGGAPFWKRLVAAGSPRSRSMAENIAQAPGCGVGAARRSVRMWMASPGHRANLLNPRHRWAGAGVAVGRGCSMTIATATYGS